MFKAIIKLAAKSGLIDVDYVPAREREIAVVDGDRERIATMIAEQIAVEQTLTASRVTWNLTFQGFTIAGFALVATSDGSAPARWLVQVLIALVSIVIAYATIAGVIASQRQRSYLRAFWNANSLSDHFPEPFSRGRSSIMGRLPALLMCWSLIGMWVILMPASYFLRDPDTTKHISIDSLPPP